MAIDLSRLWRPMTGNDTLFIDRCAATRRSGRGLHS